MVPHEQGGRRLRRRVLHPRQGPDLLLDRLPFRLGQQLRRYQHLQQVQRIVYPGEAKTDAKDAAVIADAARTMPHTLRPLDLVNEATAELTMLVGARTPLPLSLTAPSMA